MGRHADRRAAEPAPEAHDGVDGHHSRLGGTGRRLLGRRLLGRGFLAATAFVVGAVAVAWAGNEWSTAFAFGGVAAVVVLVAAWLAGTLPEPARSDEAPRPEGPQAVQ